jgi:EAL domain-containing protein (putative c-di-GMP-specific phosphodiesterase class I)
MNLLHVLDELGRSAAIAAADTLKLTSRLFINFFPTVIYDPAYSLRRTHETLHSSALRPQQIVFEVVESEYVADLEHLAEILEQYRAEGFGIALDDFGAGHGSLNLLAALHPDFIKLDIGLVQEVTSDPVRARLVNTMVHVARESGVEVVAEGVEQPETARMLADLGIRLMQGYLFGRPCDRLGTPPTPIVPAPITR